jgi:hypothetical protein
MITHMAGLTLEYRPEDFDYDPRNNRKHRNICVVCRTAWTCGRQPATICSTIATQATTRILQGPVRRHSRRSHAAALSSVQTWHATALANSQG